MAVVVFFGYAFSWMYAAIGLATKDPETAQIAGILPFFILMFASNAIVPVATMPGWLQPFARNQPLSVTVAAVRALLDGGPAGHWLGSRSPGRPACSSSSSQPHSTSTETSLPERATDGARSSSSLRAMAASKRCGRQFRMRGAGQDIPQRPVTFARSRRSLFVSG
jgi:hypothetical protein